MLLHGEDLVRQAQLMLDSHESYLLITAISVARGNGIILSTLPPCTSRKLQPSDCTILVCIKHKAYHNDLMLSNLGKHITIYSVADIMGECFSRAFARRNI